MSVDTHIEATTDAVTGAGATTIRLAYGTFIKRINSTRYRKSVQLYRKPDGVYLARYVSDPPSQRDRVEILRRARAQNLYAELPHKFVPWDAAFPPPSFEFIAPRAEPETAAD